jgi:hypothetical protein
MRTSFFICWFIIGLTLFLDGCLIRLWEAQLYGNVWLAFQTDSFMAWPFSHVLGIIGFVILVSWFFKLCLIVEKWP